MKPQPAAIGRRSQSSFNAVIQRASGRGARDTRRFGRQLRGALDYRITPAPISDRKTRHGRGDQAVESSLPRSDMTTDAAPASADERQRSPLNASKANGVMLQRITPTPAPIPRTSHRGAHGRALRKTTAASAPSAG